MESGGKPFYHTQPWILIDDQAQGPTVLFGEAVSYTCNGFPKETLERKLGVEPASESFRSYTAGFVRAVSLVTVGAGWTSVAWCSVVAARTWGTVAGRREGRWNQGKDQGDEGKRDNGKHNEQEQRHYQ